MKKQNFTREEILDLINEAYWDGVNTDKDDYAGEFFIADDYLKEFDNEKK